MNAQAWITIVTALLQTESPSSVRHQEHKGECTGPSLPLPPTTSMLAALPADQEEEENEERWQNSLLHLRIQVLPWN